jgi:hypothetical protein
VRRGPEVWGTIQVRSALAEHQNYGSVSVVSPHIQMPILKLSECLKDVYLIGMHLMDMHLMGVYFTGVYLIGMYLIGITS